jgi:hypothetical protein
MTSADVTRLGAVRMCLNISPVDIDPYTDMSIGRREGGGDAPRRCCGGGCARGGRLRGERLRRGGGGMLPPSGYSSSCSSCNNTNPSCSGCLVFPMCSSNNRVTSCSGINPKPSSSASDSNTVRTDDCAEVASDPCTRKNLLVSTTKLCSGWLSGATMGRTTSGNRLAHLE